MGSTFASDLTTLEAVSDDSDSDAFEPNSDTEEDWFDAHEDDLDDYMASAVASFASGVTQEHLSKVWRISHEEARQTIENTSQSSVWPKGVSLSRNDAINDQMLRYRQIKDYFFTDTFFATKKGGKSSRGYTCRQLFVTEKGFVYVVPMQRKGEVLQAIKQFAKEIGAPDAFVADMSGEQMSKEVKSFCYDIGTTLTALEEGTPWARKAELYVGLLKESMRKDMREANSPMVFWDYCIERRACINNLVAKSNFKLHGSNAHTLMMQEEGDISNLCQLAWYEWCSFRDHTAAFPQQKEVLGRILSPARGEGNEMCQWVLKANGKVMPRHTIRPLQTAEIHSPVQIKLHRNFDALIERRHGSAINPPKPIVDIKENPEGADVTEGIEEEEGAIPDVEDIVNSTGKLLDQQSDYDKLINAEILLQLDDKMIMGKAKGRSLGDNGKVVGSYDDNPILNSIIYDIEFPDRQVKEYSANILAENMLSQVDDNGHNQLMMDAITNFKKDLTAVLMEDKYLFTMTAQCRLRKMTLGRWFLVRWKDETECWVKLAELKDSYPVEVAEFVKVRNLVSEPAFAWWAPNTIRRRNAILSAVKAWFMKQTNKYGIEIPRDVAHAKELDHINSNTLWMDALKKEMYNVGVAFKVLEEGVRAPNGWTKVTGHLVWDVKMDFPRKAQWVLDGHKTPEPEGSTYAGVVSRESIRIALTYAALNGIDVFAADIRNAYLQAPSSCKNFIICGPEFRLENEGKVALIHHALYGGKSAGRDFCNHLRSCMHFLGFTSCPADPDVWMHLAMKSDGMSVYDYVLLYTDDTLVISENAESILKNEIGRYFEQKKESIGPPNLYLGG